MICLYRFRFSYFSLCTAVAVCAVTLGRIACLAIGPVATATQVGFLQSFYPVLLPMLLMGTLSVTIYCVPATLVLLFYRGFCDGYYVFSCVWTRDILFTLFVVCTHVFFTYGYLLLAVRCLCYRASAKSVINPFSTMDSFCFFGDFASVAGTVCLCGIFSHTVMYFCKG